jgi:hypothetical protein
MKKIALLAGLAFSLFMSTSSQAQVRINVQIGAPVVQQSWYDYDDDYYYMPDVNAYYNVRRRVYVYQDNGAWCYGNNLPGRYNGYTYGSGRYVRVRERSPFSRNDYYRRQYATNYNNNYRGNDYGRRDNGQGRGGYNRGDRNQNYGNNGGGNWNGGNSGNNNNGGWNGGNGDRQYRGR